MLLRSRAFHAVVALPDVLPEFPYPGIDEVEFKKRRIPCLGAQCQCSCHVKFKRILERTLIGFDLLERESKALRNELNCLSRNWLKSTFPFVTEASG